VGRAVF